MVLPVLVSSSDLYSISYLIPWKWIAINCQLVTSPHLTRVLCQIVKMFGVVTSVFALCWLPSENLRYPVIRRTAFPQPGTDRASAGSMAWRTTSSNSADIVELFVERNNSHR